MLGHNPSVWFGGLTKTVFGEPIAHYTRILLDDIAPIFADFDGKQRSEATRCFEDVYKQGFDAIEAAEIAEDYGLERALQYCELGTVFLATGAAGLFHLFEKQLYLHLNRELRGWLKAEIKDWKCAESYIELLDHPEKSNGRSALQLAFGDKDLRELRLAANAIKHGPGRSYDELQKMNAPIVDKSRIDDDWTVGESSVFGVSLAINPEDIKRYTSSILRFWSLNGTFRCMQVTRSDDQCL